MSTPIWAPAQIAIAHIVVAQKDCYHFRYELATATPTKSVFTVPYFDAGGVGIVLTIAKALISEVSTK